MEKPVIKGHGNIFIGPGECFEGSIVFIA